jgi:acyl carrier protein
MSVFDRLQPIISKAIGAPVSAVTLEASRSEFAQWDSWAHLDLVMEVEAEFGCSFTMEETTGIGSVRDFVELISRKTVR